MPTVPVPVPPPQKSDTQTTGSTASSIAGRASRWQPAGQPDCQPATVVAEPVWPVAGRVSGAAIESIGSIATVAAGLEQPRLAAAALGLAALARLRLAGAGAATTASLAGATGGSSRRGKIPRLPRRFYVWHRLPVARRGSFGLEPLHYCQEGVAKLWQAWAPARTIANSFL